MRLRGGVVHIENHSAKHFGNNACVSRKTSGGRLQAFADVHAACAGYSKSRCSNSRSKVACVRPRCLLQRALDAERVRLGKNDFKLELVP